jgi:polyhydroxyalkanoate synthesis regulator phasin
MAKLIDEIAKQSALVDEKLDHADLSLQQARIVAELAYMAAVQCQAIDTLVARIEALEKKVKKLQKSEDSQK